MLDREDVIREIHRAFDHNDYPGDAFLQGSFDGSEPAEEIEPFRARPDWKTLEPALLDAHYSALSFFSEAGFRFFLPAYLVADLRDELQSADPLFHLTSGFFVTSVKIPAGSRTFVRVSGGSALLNPKRYGAMTWLDHARFRLSVFTREEARAIVAYLRYRRQADTHGLHTAAIDAALDSFWLDRAEHAPSREHLDLHVQNEDEYVAAISASYEDVT